MSDILELQKKELKAKELEFKRLAVSSYGAYLRELHKVATKDSSKTQYAEYLEKEIDRNQKQLNMIDKEMF